MSRILLLEDDTMIASGILYALESEGYETNHATRIKDARSGQTVRFIFLMKLHPISM